MTPTSDELVITPGGPRAADLVHKVPPDGIVDARRTFAPPHLLPAQQARVQRLLATGDYAITPGGVRPKSMIHLVKPGEVVRQDKDRFKRFDMERKLFIEPPPVLVDMPELPGLGSGWITYASYVEPAANVITEMRTTWTVPPEPTREDGQLIYIFNGMQDSPVTHILQPVLQWGRSPAGGGNSWAVASWFVGSGGDAFKTDPIVQVNPGDVLTGVMKLLTNHDGNFFYYICYFDGLPGTQLGLNSLSQMVNPVQTLECYTIQECRDYPNALLTSMHSIDVRTKDGSLAPNFAAANSVTDCGQHATVVSNAAGAGQVDLYYAQQITVPTPTVVTSLSRMRDQIDLFVVGTDGSVDSTFWNPQGGWFNRWFALIDPRFGDRFTVPPQSEVSVLSRAADHLDLFTVGRDNAVYSTYWDGNWPNNWFRLADENFGDRFTVPAKTPVSALARRSDQIDLFVVGFDGSIFSTFWNAQSGWFNHWFRLGDPNFGDGFTIPPGSPISSLARMREQIDLFVAGRDGGVYSTFWNPATGWFGHWFRLEDARFGDHFTIPPGAPVTSLARMPNQIDLFVAGRDGGIYSTFWNSDHGWFNQWFRLGDANFGDGFTIPAGAPVSAIARMPNQIDLFVAGRDGGIYSTFWNSDHGWFNHWFRLGDPNFGDGFTVPPGSRVTAQARDPNIIDLFVVGRDGGIYSTYWNGNWPNTWFRL